MIAQDPTQPVIHLVAPPSNTTGGNQLGRLLPTLLCAHAQESGLFPKAPTIVVGDQTAEQSAAALGIKHTARIAPVFRNPRFMARNLQSLITRDTHIICWSDELISMASSVCPSTELISTAPRLARRSFPRHTLVRVLDEADRDTWNECQQRTATIDRDMLPLLDSYQTRHSRESIRKHLGISERTLCIGAMADCPQSTNAKAFSFLLGLLSCIGYDLVGIAPSNAHGITNARRHHRSLHQPFRFIHTSDPILTLLPALDLMLHMDANRMSDAFLLERLVENADVPCIRLDQDAFGNDMRSSKIATPIINQIDAILGIPAGSRVTP
ncbi:MAG: hypothetical protein JKY96_03500 [Phycisphaerales bacterium]|nr:hypothetical protein [Phycisphaerales bacterium]